MFVLHLILATAIFVVDCCQFGPNWIFGLKMELMACADLVCGKTEQSCIFPDIILNNIINDMKNFQTVSITPQPCHSHFCC